MLPQQPSPQRHGWTFPHTRAHLLAAAQTRRDFHEARAKFWQDKLASVEATIREKGLDFRQNIPERYMGATTNYYQQQIVVDNTLTQEHGQAQGRLRHHQQLAEEFRRWTVALSANGAPSTYNLTIDDIAYFWPSPGQDTEDGAP